MTINDEDKEFWLSAVSDVVPSKKDDIVTGKEKTISIKAREHQRQYSVKHEYSEYSKFLDDMEFGGIDKATLRKFKREEFACEAVLDLHGKTENDAFSVVEDFIVRSYNAGKRCVIIITGKGLSVHSDDIFATKGILKKSVPQWLNAPRLRAMVLVYKHPSARLGGDGALYILLRRNKNI